MAESRNGSKKFRELLDGVPFPILAGTVLAVVLAVSVGPWYVATTSVNTPAGYPYITFDMLMGDYDRDARKFKSYTVGDTIIVRDRVASCEYNKNYGYTILTFLIDTDDLDILVQGDVTVKYPTGTVVFIKCTVIKYPGFEQLNTIISQDDIWLA